MAKQEGYIYLDRSLCDHWLYTEKPFDKARAWIDLIFLAEYKTHTKMYRGKMKTYKKGDVNKSILSLADRWGWSRQKVRRFLNQLVDDGMVQVNATTNDTTITIVKYGDFQNKRTTNGTTDDTTDVTTERTSDVTTDVTHLRNNKESIRKEKEIKHTFGEYQNVKLTDRQLVKLISDYDESTIDSAIEFLDEYIQEKGYKSKDHNLAIRRWVVDAVKGKQKKTQSKQTAFHNFDMKHDYDFDEMEQQLLQRG